MNNQPIDKNYYWNLGLETLKELETENGILASSRSEAYGCIFGRDSLIVALKLLRLHRKHKVEDFLPLVKKMLLRLCELQGQAENKESGEQPGKCIHEYRPDAHEHLTKNLNPPWYIYPDQVMRNYDSVDATLLFLVAIYRYWQISQDNEFIVKVLPNVHLALNWIFDYGDSNNDGFVDYQTPLDRKHGGLVTQNWMDSVESVFHEDPEDSFVFPLAPAEVQAYTFLALKLWSNYFEAVAPKKSAELFAEAVKLKKLFNQKFITTDPENNMYVAFKIDGEGRQFRSVRSSMGHCLWASTEKDLDGKTECILEDQYIPWVVKRLMMPDLFEETAGIRTLSRFSRNFESNSYHNGSIWPHDNSLIAEGFEIHGFHAEAARVKQAVMRAIDYFKTPIELFAYMDEAEVHYCDYCSASGQTSCKKQAWSAVAIMDMV